MNTAEKLAATYLRLNGFLLLPHFTVFDGEHHNHIDLIGYRLANSKELVHGEELLRDTKLFEKLTEMIEMDSNASSIGIIVEVRSNENRDKISDGHINYVRNFLGGIQLERITFCCANTSFLCDQNGLRIDLKHSFDWIQERINWMEARKDHLSKMGSWTLSEEFLSDLLSLRRIDAAQ
jgi:hypothetical protein